MSKCNECNQSDPCCSGYTSTNCDHPCVTTTSIAPMPLCFSISPCNEGCTENVKSDCVTLSKDTQLFLKGQSLTSIIATIEDYLSKISMDYNQTYAEQLIRYTLRPEFDNFTIIVKMNTVEVLNQTYSDVSSLYADLLLLAPSWTLTNGILHVRGTDNWEFELTY